MNKLTGWMKEHKLTTICCGIAIIVLIAFFVLNTVHNHQDRVVTTWSSTANAETKISKAISGIDGEQKTVVVTFKNGCSTCHAAMPDIMKAAKKHAKDTQVIYLDVNKEYGKRFVRHYSIKNLPTAVTITDSGDKITKMKLATTKGNKVTILSTAKMNKVFK